MRIVVVGNGMVGSRFAQDAARQVPGAHVTVLGKENRGPYNRVLLSSLVAGTTDERSLNLDDPVMDGLSVRTGVHASSIDRDARTVTASDGSVHRYDRLVLATGSSARIPPIFHVGGPGGLMPGVSVLKDIGDAHKILAQLHRTRHAVVLGAGVLGIEVATGLAARGVAVTLVHHADRAMDRQLGSVASQTAMDTMARLGIRVVTSTTIARVFSKRGRLISVQLRGGEDLPAELLVLCAGTVPETHLARAAGLPCERGIVVGDDLASPSDPSIFAIGDCAQPPEGGTGLVAQGWEQAARLVDAWSRPADGPAPREEPAPDATNVVRVKASGLDVATMGLSGKFEHGDRELRAVRISDPAVGRFVEVVVCQGQLVGATVVGDKATASRLAAIYTRGLPVPGDPAHLIVAPIAGATPAVKSASEMADDDTVCQCNTVSKGRICAAIEDGCRTREDVARATRASTGCGDCTSLVKELLAATTADNDMVPELAGAGRRA